VVIFVSGRALSPVRIRIEASEHVIMNFLLQINAERAIAANDFVRAHAGIGWNIATGIGDANVVRNVACRVVAAFDGRSTEFREKITLRLCPRRATEDERREKY
jgi:hypothetical protein